MTPGQTRVLVLLGVLLAIELTFSKTGQQLVNWANLRGLLGIAPAKGGTA